MIDHILVPLDGSILANCVLPHVVALAKALGSPVTLLRVLDPAATTGSGFVDLLDWHMGEAEALAYLDEIGAHLEKAGVQVKTELLEGKSAESIVEFARSHHVNLILLSSHGQSGLSVWNVSSVVQKVILQANTSIMIVRSYQPIESTRTDLHYRKILLPLDGSHRADLALASAQTLARFHSSELLLAHVLSAPVGLHRVPLGREHLHLSGRLEQHDRLVAEQYLEECRAWAQPAARTRLLVNDSVAGALHELAEEEKVDLVILTAHGRSGYHKWPYGCVALSFISYGTTPLLVVQDLSPEEVEPCLAEKAVRETKGH